MPLARRFPSRLPRGLARAWWKLALVLLGLAAAVQTGSAQGVVIYRCTDASGALTIQNDTPCPKGSKQDRRVMEAAPSSPTPPFVAPMAAPRPIAPAAPARAPAPVAPPPEPEPAPAPERTIVDSDRLPPPWLYECRTFDDDSYLSENGNPPPRCVTLTTTGLSGMIESTNTSACEMKTDRCQRVPDGALCEAWRKRLREAQSTLRFGVTENRERDLAEVARMTRITQESTCGY
ncbi:DUF4124 domain-containing protein [Lysobacter niabensis]|uniref:DUF4124 domain-containing protein n=1 Tax=Agrilutibacter niabensis TaxID=380628 RepID=UPI00361E4609